ncbi:MAG: LacI family transcriptional regulator, partial [Phycisphaerae bacterium]|nr:LacI family transcriptional regulator [Phycisphaerae bacterium]
MTEVAKLAGVSYATASRVINGHPSVSARAVRVVREAMKTLGYTPPVRRRGPRPKAGKGIRTGSIALLQMTDTKASTATTLLRNVQKHLAGRRLNLFFAEVHSPDDLPPAVKAGEIDGIMGFGSFPSEAVTDRLLRLPAVWMMTAQANRPDAWGDRVRPDHAKIGRLAAEYLLGKGYRSLAYADMLRAKWIIRPRGKAFCDTAGQAGVTVRRVGNNNFTFRSLRERNTDRDRVIDGILDELMAAMPKPVGLFVPLDMLTVAFYHRMIAKGIVPGRDVEIISCDNDRELLSSLSPRPVSIDVGWDAIGRTAVER